MLSGAPNFRDLGGQVTRDGRVLRHGCLLRSGHLGELQPQDVALVQDRFGRDLAVVDLRSDAERAARPACVLPGAAIRCLPIEPTVARKLDALAATGEPLTEQAARRFMGQAYEGFVSNARPQLAALFEHVLERGGRPVLVHCAHGKDRTGFMVAMLLAALDVPRRAILDDYLLTNQRVSPRESGRYPAEILRVLGTVRAEFLEAAFAAIEAECGSVDDFLQQAGALTPARRERLRGLLLA